MSELPLSDHLARSLDSLRLSIDQLRSDVVRKDVYDAQRLADQHEVRDVIGDVAEMRANSKWLFRTFIVALVIPLANSIALIWITQQVVK